MVATGVWAYWQNHNTSRAKAHLVQLERRLQSVERDIVVYQIEWSNLNRPARLRALADQHFDALGLIEITARSYATIDAFLPLHQKDQPMNFEGVEMLKMPSATSGEKP